MNRSSIYQRDRDYAANSEEFREQWRNPFDVLSILLIIGGDVVQKAIAQLSGRGFVPVSFSFGWVAYSFSTLVSIIGDGRLLPDPDYECKVINLESGYSRENRNWVIGRLFRDLTKPDGDEHASLIISVYNAIEDGGLQAGAPKLGSVQVICLAVIVIQLSVASIPLGLYGEWGVFLITAAGTILALLAGMLPQWRIEKFACRQNSRKRIALSRGNGARHVVVIFGNRVGLDLEDLAAGESPRDTRPWESHGLFTQKGSGDQSRRIVSLFLNSPLDFWLTRIIWVILSIAWLVLMISSVALERNSWFLLAVGAIGMIQNVVLAGIALDPSSRGIHIQIDQKFVGEHKVMDALMKFEKSYPGLGKPLLREFFPGELRPEEKEWWNSSHAKDGAERISPEITSV